MTTKTLVLTAEEIRYLKRRLRFDVQFSRDLLENLDGVNVSRIAERLKIQQEILAKLNSV